MAQIKEILFTKVWLRPGAVGLTVWQKQQSEDSRLSKGISIQPIQARLLNYLCKLRASVSLEHPWAHTVLLHHSYWDAALTHVYLDNHINTLSVPGWIYLTNWDWNYFLQN